ncbi:MAG: hypothetical protein OXG25_02425 [Gammaproteobacteria bacterium]|nr:hypothetical protein [Gammaproteobacteria bacterium]
MAESALNPTEKLYSEWQQPVNRWADLPNSIHNDSVATKIGMRGGTIPGTVHLNHFVPLIQDTWGMAWYEKGAISMYYTFATTHKEDVRAVMVKPALRSEDKVDAFVETPEEKIVCKGSLSVGDSPKPNYVASLPLEDAPRSELRILDRMKTGMECPERDDVIATEGKGSGDYEGIVELPTGLFQMLQTGAPTGTLKKAVGFYGATEIRTLKGPIRVDTEYRRVGKVVCVGASPKTEYVWIDSQLLDKSSGDVVAEMRQFSRFMKASSDLWS